MRIPGWQAQFSEYRSAIYYLGHLLPLSTGFGVGQRRHDPAVGPSRDAAGLRNTYYDPLNCGGCGPEHEWFFRDTCCNGKCERNNTQHCGFECYPCAPARAVVARAYATAAAPAFILTMNVRNSARRQTAVVVTIHARRTRHAKTVAAPVPLRIRPNVVLTVILRDSVCCGLTGLEGACPPGEVCCNLPDGTHCIPEGGDCCGFSHYCEPGEKCCGNGCIPSGEC